MTVDWSNHAGEQLTEQIRTTIPSGLSNSGEELKFARGGGVDARHVSYRDM